MLWIGTSGKLKQPEAALERLLERDAQQLAALLPSEEVFQRT